VVEESVRKMSEKAWGMLKNMRMQILGHPAPYVVVRGAAISIGVDPSGSECDSLVDELLQAGYIQRPVPLRVLDLMRVSYNCRYEKTTEENHQVYRRDSGTELAGPGMSS
jgi:hypothetical protein